MENNGYDNETEKVEERKITPSFAVDDCYNYDVYDGYDSDLQGKRNSLQTSVYVNLYFTSLINLLLIFQRIYRI